MTSKSAKSEDSRESTSHLTSPELPVPLSVWRIFLVLAVFLYSSYTIFVHLCEVDGHLPFRPSAVVLLTELLKLFARRLDFVLERCAVLGHCHSDLSRVSISLTAATTVMQRAMKTSCLKCNIR
ncbi:hypothetical protein FGIG_03852 [Fasciola gigantica]|uniref:Uncharacterized protein n=1 Tax=Fasciola gigantica TaxID=46835 RepID=A0A504YUV5_FASGI|nr:hypothetical protein FGIG_03852 [Fasciola gigantica]